MWGKYKGEYYKVGWQQKFGKIQKTNETNWDKQKGYNGECRTLIENVLNP